MSSPSSAGRGRMGPCWPGSRASRTPIFTFRRLLGEIEAGIEITRDQDPEKAAESEAWLDQVAETYNILPMDAPAFRSWALLMHCRSDKLIEDAMIAATAKVHKLIVVTRNVKDFEQFGVTTFNPFETNRS